METDQVEETVVTSGKPERDGKSTGNPVYNPDKFKVEKERIEVIETVQVCELKEVIVALEVLPGLPTKVEKNKLPASGRNKLKVEPSLDKKLIQEHVTNPWMKELQDASDLMLNNSKKDL